MDGYKGNIEGLTLKNSFFRQVVFTSKQFQLVLMNLKPSEEIGFEVHEQNDQFFRFEKGQGQVVINGSTCDISDGDAVIVPMGSRHNVINTSQTDNLVFYTLYSPPHHKDKTIHKTKAEAESSEQEFDGVTSL